MPRRQYSRTINAMATKTTTITINREAHRTLKELRRPGETYSDAILNNVRPPAETGEEILQRLKAFQGKNLVDPELMAIVRSGRGRRSPRKIRNAA